MGNIGPVPATETDNSPQASHAAKQIDPYLVTFAEPYDAENPKDWPASRKWAVTDVLSATGFNRILVSTIMAPALSTIGKELDMSPTESALSLSIYVLATAFGPLFIGPLSEIYGRKVILHASNVWFLIWNITCAFVTTKELLIAARFLAGFGASAIYALGGGVLGDIWRPEERGRSLGAYLLIPLLGAAVGMYMQSKDKSATHVRTKNANHANDVNRTHTGRCHNAVHYLAMDVLVDVYLPRRHDRSLVRGLPRDLCTRHPDETRCQNPARNWRYAVLHGV